MSELFRREAVAHATRRLDGQVVLATPLSVSTLGLLLAVIVFGATVFAALGTYSRKATVAGYLIPDQGMIRAAAATSATLQSLMVKEGDIVDAGDRIAVLGLSTETSGGNVGEVISQGLASETTAARAKAESRLAQLEVEREQANIRLSKSQAEQTQIATQASLQEQRLQIARDEFGRAVEIAKKGFLAKREVEARRLNVLTSEQELANLHRQIAANESVIADINARLASIPLEIDGARSEASTAEATLDQRRAEANARRLQFVIAPVSGRIAALPVTTGQAIAAGSTIAIVVPVGGKLEAELLAPARAIGVVQPGRAVEISLGAVP
jgi:membrane fusion protein